MRRIITLIIMFVMSILLLTGCAKNRVFDQNKVIPPMPDNISIEGVWKPTSYEVIEESFVEENQQKNLMDKLITINRDSVIIGNNIVVENPKFKLKRLTKNEYEEGNKKITSKYDIKDKEYVDILSVSNNDNKTYFNIIQKDDKHAILFTSTLYNPTTVAEIEKIAVDNKENSKIEENEQLNNSENLEKKITSQNKYYKLDTGVLVGLKTPSSTNSSGKLSAPKYRTLWISMVNDKVQPIKELDNILLLPRTNGFSKIQLECSNNSMGHKEVLTVSSNKKGEKEVQSVFVEDNSYKDITFLGNDYIGLRYYEGNDFDDKYNKYKILPIDSLNTKESIDIISLLGEKGKEAYDNSKQKFLEVNKSNNLSSFNLKDDYKNMTLIRKNGQWELEALINSKEEDNKIMTFPINFSPVNTLVNYDSMLMPWNKVKDFNPYTRDLISSPNFKLAIALIDDRLIVYKIKNGRIMEEELVNIKISSNEEIVMAEWTTGDFVNYWNNAVDEYGGTVVNLKNSN